MEQPKKESINIMNCSISSIYYCPVKSLSFQNIESCNVKKELGMINDRIFAFSRGLDLEKAKSIEANPSDRKLNNLLIVYIEGKLNNYRSYPADDKSTVSDSIGFDRKKSSNIFC